MAYTAIYANGSTFNMVKKFVIDSFNEIYDIDTSQLSPGSTTFDISSSKIYMLNNKKQWIEIQTGTGSGGGGGASPSAKQNDVTFIDYDGSILYSYSLEEAQALTDLPTLPSHDGLICQGWNWTLEAIKALNRPVTVGAMYITDDGATRLHIKIATVGRMTVPLYIGQTVANGVSIDWGDGSTAETLADTGNVNTSHTYAEPGDYVILLIPQDGCTLSFGNGTTSYCVMGATGNKSMIYRNMLKEVYIGKNVTSIDSSAFFNCPSLSSITIPTGVTSIDTKAFSNCSSLESIVLPTGVSSIDSSAFSSCPSLSSIVIPDGVTSIGSNAFQNCFGMRYYDFSACTAIPALGSPNVFGSIPSDCQMLIPSELYSNWKIATNWATYKSYMVAV